MRTANPALNSKTFTGTGRVTDASQAMTIQGTVNKTVFLLILVMISSSWVWNMFYGSGSAAAVMPWVYGGAIGGLIVAIVTIFRKQWSGITAPVYSLLEGCFLGGGFLLFLKPGTRVLSSRR